MTLRCARAVGAPGQQEVRSRDKRARAEFVRQRQGLGDQRAAR